MKRVLVAGVLGGLLILGTPTLAFSAGNRDNGGGHESHNNGGGGGHNSGGNHGSHDSDHRGRDGGGGRYDGRYDRGRYGYYYGDPYYYGGYQDCYHDPSGYTTCEPYGGDYDPGGYNGGYQDPPPDPQYCSQRHSAHSAQCPEDSSPPPNSGSNPPPKSGSNPPPNSGGSQPPPKSGGY